MPYEFVARNGIIALKDSAITGSLNVSGSLTVGGTITATTLVVQTITSSTSWITGSTKFGSVNTNTHEFTGSVSISGSSTFGLNVNNNALYVAAGGNIGIGTSSPSEKLHIYSTSSDVLRLTSTTASSSLNFAINGDGYSTAIIRNLNDGPASTSLRFFTWTSAAMTEKLTLFYNGNIGVGSTSPGAKLDVTGNIRTSTYYNFNGNPSVPTDSTAAVFDQSGVGPTVSGLNVTFRAGSTPSEIMRVASSGNVGIGTTSPGAKLQVTVPAGSYNASITNQAGLSGSITIQADSSGTMSRASLIMRGSDSIGGAIAVAREDPGSTWRTYMAFYTNNLTVSDVTAIQEKMRINSDGNVGIGISSPSYKLHVVSVAEGLYVEGANTSPYTQKIAEFKYAGNSNSIYIQNISGQAGFASSTGTNLNFQPAQHSIFHTGNVGIGTSSPTQLLHIVGTNAANNGITLQNTNASGNSQVRFLNTAGTERAAITYLNGADAVYHYTAGGGNLLNLVGANVGIGTTSPVFKLQVNGSVSLNTSTDGSARYYTYPDSYHSWYYDSDIVGSSADIITYYENFLVRYQDSTNVFLINGNGNVGIGTTSPAVKLEVNGSIRLSGTGYIGFGGGTNYIEGDNPNNIIKFGTNNTEKVRINGDGNVGIGTTSIGNKIVVYDTQTSTTNASAVIVNVSSAASLPTRMLLALNGIYNSGGNGHNLFINSSDNSGVWDFNFTKTWGGTMTFGVSSDGTTITRQVAINSSGNVGIGTTAPTTKLEVVGSTSNINGYADGAIQITGLSPIAFVAPSNLNPSLNRWGFKVREVNEGDFSIYDYRNSITRILINSNGNVGVGTTAPNSTFQISKGGVTFQVTDTNKTANNTLSIYGYSQTSFAIATGNSGSYSGGEKIIITDGGNIGIGTTAPAVRLHTYLGASSSTAASNAIAIFEDDVNAVVQINGPDANAVGLFFGRSGAAYYSGIERSGTDLLLKNNSGTVITINSGGNVGINTTSPSVKFHVIGSSILANGTAIDPDSYNDTVVAGSIQDGSGWALTGIGGNAGTGDSWSIGHNGSHLYMGMQNGSAANTMQTYIRFDPNRNLYLVEFSGNVGIGTTSPAYKLTVKSAGTSTFALGVTNQNNNIIGGIYETSGNAGQLYLSDNTTEKIKLSTVDASYFNGGNVGIGTTSPGATLHVYKAASNDELVTLSNSTSGGITQIGFQQNDSDGMHHRAYIKAYKDTGTYAGRLDFLIREATTATAVTRMVIRTDGNVGIGTTSPAARLHVSSSSYPSFVAQGAGSNALQLNVPDVTFSTNTGSIEVITGPLAQDWGTGFRVGTTSGASNAYDHTYIEFYVSAYPNKRVARMRITEEGSVGIGTTNPAYVLHTVGSPVRFDRDGKDIIINPNYGGGNTNADIQTGTGMALTFSPVGTERMRITSGGNVGIGTTAPAFKLETIGNSRISGNLSINTTYNGFAANIEGVVYVINGSVWVTDGYGYAHANATNTGMFPDSGNNITFKTNNSTRVYITSGGNVGIGTTSPSSLLHLSVGNVDGIRVQSSNCGYLETGKTNGARWRWTNEYNAANILELLVNDLAGGVPGQNVLTVSGISGNVGIGTTSPSNKLQVVGGVTATSFTGSFSGSVVAPGSNTNVIYNSSGVLAGSNNFIFDGTNVGIGATSPATRLSLAGSTSTTFGLSLEPSGWNSAKHRFTVHTSGDTSMWSFNWNGSVVDSALYAVAAVSVTQGGVLFYTTGSANSPAERMRINSDGNVCINTTSAVDKLTVGTGSIILTNSNNYGLVWNHSSWTGNAYITLANTFLLKIASHTGINFFTNQLNEGEVSRMFISSNGNVGIGTTSPSATFSVFGKTILGNQTSGFYVPSSTLHIASSSVAQITFEDFVVTAGIAVSSSVMNFGNQQSDATYRFKYSNTYNGNYATTGTTYVQFNPTTNYINSGNVGIGTTSPLQLLHINGNILLDGISNGYTQAATRGIGYGSNSGAISVDGFSGMDIQSVNAPAPYNGNYSQNLRFFTHHYGAGTGGTPRMFIQYNGNVGIGTTSPTDKFVVAGGNVLFFPSDNTRQLSFYNSNYGITAASGLELFTGDYIRFRKGSSEYVRIDSNGNLGIGTTSPGLKLDVIGSARIGQTSNSSTSAVLELTAGGSGYNSFIDFGYYNTFDAAIWYAGYFGADGGQFKIKDAGSGIAYDRVVIAGGSITFPSSSLGIGTTSPSVRLHTVGSSSTELRLQNTDANNNYGFVKYDTTIASTGGNLYIGTNASGGGYGALIFTANNNVEFNGNGDLYIIKNGNVGIGTSSPGYKIHVEGSSYFNGNMGVNGEGSGITVDTGYGNNGRVGFMKYAGYEGMLIAGNATVLRFGHRTDSATVAGGSPTIREDIRIAIDGNVGIGTTSPVYKLQVYGGLVVAGATTTQLAFLGADGSNVAYVGSLTNHNFQLRVNNSARVTIDTNGNVGVGTTSPVYILDVSGTGKISGQFVQGAGAARSTSGTTIVQTFNHAFSANADIGDTYRFLSIVNESTTTNAYSNVCFRVNPNSSGGGSNAMLDMKFVNANSSNASTLYWTFLSGGSFYDRMSLTSAGLLTVAGDVVAYGSPSDITLKTNIKPLKGALEKITKLQGVSFTWKEDTDSNKMVGIKDDIGFIAQEVQEIIPELVRKNDNGLLSLRDKGITALLVEAIKEQQRQIEDLKYLLSQK